MIKKSIVTGCGIYLASLFFGIMLSGYMNNIKWFDDSVVKMTALDIFVHNIISSSIMLLGLLSFGIITILYLMYNGILLGVTAAKGGIYMVITKILPHGIFEISGVCLIAAIGLFPVWFLWYKYNKRSMDISIKKIALMLIAAVILLLIASIIESSIM